MLKYNELAFCQCSNRITIHSYKKLNDKWLKEHVTEVFMTALNLQKKCIGLIYPRAWKAQKLLLSKINYDLPSHRSKW